MLIAKYTRIENAAFVPHLDTLRAVTMAIRRIGAKAQYSEGFNPHMKIFFGQPLPIGTESECEYFCAYVDEPADEFVRKMNGALPRGLRISAAAQVEKDPNVAKIMCFADYTVTMRDIQRSLDRVSEFATRPVCEIEYQSKGESVRKDVKELIADLRATDGKTLYMRLCCGNRNLRADRLMDFLCKEYNLTGGYDVRKTNMYDCNGNNLDKILFGSGKY